MGALLKLLAEAAKKLLTRPPKPRRAPPAKKPSQAKKDADKKGDDSKEREDCTGNCKPKPKTRKDYEREVANLKKQEAAMRAQGKSSEEIARKLSQARRDLGVKYKDLTPPDMLKKIYDRNLQRYGDKLGPTIDRLRSQGKTWEQIIESATRPGGKDLGF